MVILDNYVSSFNKYFSTPDIAPWKLVNNLSQILTDMIMQLEDNYIINNRIAIHKTAIIENNVVLKAPVIIGMNCFVGANSYLRQGVFLTKSVTIGTNCEIKSSVIFENSSIAHFNFIGDSIIGNYVNFEAGSITANHYNERIIKNIYVMHNDISIDTKCFKFGSVVGDHSKIGANAVLSPGTLLNKNTIVKRLQLIEQHP